MKCPILRAKNRRIVETSPSRVELGRVENQHNSNHIRHHIRNQTRASLVEGECNHHCDKPVRRLSVKDFRFTANRVSRVTNSDKHFGNELRKSHDTNINIKFPTCHEKSKRVLSQVLFYLLRLT